MKPLYDPSPWQQLFHTIENVDELLGAGDLALDTELPTPDGMRAIRDVREGDMVFSSDGAPCKVKAEQWLTGQRCFRVCFDDGQEIVAGEWHRWWTLTYLERKATLRTDGGRRQKGPSFRTTLEVLASLKHLGKTNHTIPNAGSLQISEKALPVDPWLVGQWLANGRKDLAMGLEITSPFKEVEELARGVSTRAELELHVSEGHGDCRTLYFAGSKGRENALVARMRKLFREDTFRIPQAYILSSESQRWELLRGLIDGDGHVNKNGIVELTFQQQGLVRDCFRLASSLGFKCTMDTCQNRSPRTGAETSLQHRLHFSALGKPVSNVARKQERAGNSKGRTQLWRYIVNVVEVESIPTKCIHVDHPSQTFLALSACIPTGNSAGPGKSLCLLMDPVPKVIQEHDRCTNKEHPFHIPYGHSSGWALHLRREFSMLEQTIGRAHRIFTSMDPGCKWDSGAHTFVFSSGYRYQFGHCQHREDYIKYMSNEYDHIMYDEANQFLEEQYDQINSRLRSSDPVLRHQLKIRLMSNPVMQLSGTNVTVDDPFWLRRRFVDPDREGNTRLVKWLTRPDGRKEKYTIMYLPAKLSANPDKAFVDSYERTLLSKKTHIRRALLDGDWYVTAGAFFGEVWNPAVHTCAPFKIPRDWPQFRSMDWGYKNPGVVYWYAMDPDNTLYVHREYVFQGKSASDVAESIKGIEEKLGLWQGKYSRVSGPADTQLWEQRGESGLSKASEMSVKGVNWLRADKRSRQRNAERLLERMKNLEQARGTHGIVFFETCKMAIQTIPSIPTSRTNPEEPMDGGEDHYLDAVEYGVAHASRGRDAIAVVNDEDQDWGKDEAKDRLIGKASRFGYGYRS